MSGKTDVDNIREAGDQDKKEVLTLISHCLAAHQRSEFGRHIKRLFSHYSLWLGSAVIIILLGIPLDLPVVAVSAFVFMSMFFFNKFRFQKFWRQILPYFDRKSPDLLEVISYYNQDRRKILIMTVHGIVGGVVCLKESEAEEDDKTCQLSRLYVHPDCRRLGISNRLLQEAKIEALKMGYKRMQVETFENNTEMNQFCNKKNFSLQSRETRVDVYPLSFTVNHYELDLVRGKIFS